MHTKTLNKRLFSIWLPDYNEIYYLIIISLKILHNIVDFFTFERAC